VSLQGKVAVITGGSRGIGGACSKLLAARGARVVLSYLNNKERAENLVAEIAAAGGEAQAVQADARDAEQINRFIGQAYERYQRVDVLVSNAPAGFADRSFGEISWDEYGFVVNNCYLSREIKSEGGALRLSPATNTTSQREQ